MLQWRFVVLILLYITLDLSLASMPGAFVFDAGASVETVQLGRTQDAASSVSVPAAAEDRRVAVAVEDARRMPRHRSPVVPQILHPIPGRRRAVPELAPPSKDPH